MLALLTHLLIDASVVMLASSTMDGIKVRSFSTAFAVAILIGVLSFVFGWLYTFVLDVATLGLFYFLGLGFVTRTIAYAFVIQMVSSLKSGFKTSGFFAALWLAMLLALVGSVLDGVIL